MIEVISDLLEGYLPILRIYPHYVNNTLEFSQFQQFRKILNRELKESSDAGNGTSEISAWVYNTFIGKLNLTLVGPCSQLVNNVGQRLLNFEFRVFMSSQELVVFSFLV